MSMTDTLGFSRPLRFSLMGNSAELARTMRAFGGLRMPERHLAPPSSLGRIGSLEVRLATTSSEIRRAQKLRWNVFYREMSAVPVGALRFFRRDVDRFDAICDHLIVVDHERMELSRMGRLRPAIVGTYRLLRGDVAERHGGFYSASEFDLSGLLARHQGARFLELGRSCVEKPYRNKRTVELLWHGIWGLCAASPH